MHFKHTNVTMANTDEHSASVRESTRQLSACITVSFVRTVRRCFCLRGTEKDPVFLSLKTRPSFPTLSRWEHISRRHDTVEILVQGIRKLSCNTPFTVIEGTAIPFHRKLSSLNCKQYMEVKLLHQKRHYVSIMNIEKWLFILRITQDTQT